MAKLSQLRIVKLPATVVRIEESSFQGCCLLAVSMLQDETLVTEPLPNAAHFSTLTSGGTNTLAPGTTLAQYLSESCLNLSSITFKQASTPPATTASRSRKELGEGRVQNTLPLTCAPGLYF